MPPIAAQTPGRNHQPRKKPRRSDPTSSPPSLSDGRLPQKAFQSQPVNRAKTPYPGYEFWIYRQLRKRLAAGELHLDDSLQHRCFSDELVTLDRTAEALRELDIPWLRQPLDA